MSGRLVSRGQNERSLKKYYTTKEKHPILPNVSNPNSLLYDKNEFPPLSELVSQKVSLKKPQPITEISGKPDDYVFAGQTLKYSDKLKFSCQNQTHPQKSLHSKNEHAIAVNSQVEDKACNRQSSSKSEHALTRTLDKKCSSSNNCKISSSETKFENSRNFYDSPVQKTKKHLYQPNTINGSSKLADYKNQPQKQIACLHNSPNSNSKHSSPKTTASFSLNYNALSSESQSQSKEIKYDIILDKSKINNEDEKNKTKKKKRKSKVKRQAAFQTGKINVLTPEIHSKILNQSNSHKLQHLISVLTDINDEEEYPELGKSFVPSSQKENSAKKECNSVELTSGDTKRISDAPSEKQKLVKDLPLCSDEKAVEKKVKSEKAIHPNDPITVTFYEMLLMKPSKAKVKDFKNEMAAPSNGGLTKIKSKKSLSHPHNLLDSSSPAVKRGKERENPKPKKPSQLKKIILLDRKVRREQLLQLKSNEVDDGTHDMESGILDDCINSIEKVNLCDSDAEELNKILGSICEKGPINLEPKELNEGNIWLQSDDYDACEIIPYKDISGLPGNVLRNNLFENTVSKDSNYSIGKKKDQTIVPEVSGESTYSTEKHLNVLESNDSLLKSLSDTVKNLEVSEKEKAAKILLHTRNFREYCNHLISKDIDDAAFALLDDLARFQDRMHQKDPVKARMKRRMIYGVKEVKKHIKLKKLRCIIIATDIENVEAEGGLNDILNDIKSLAADHNVPCIFALGRKALGKVCHKPVPVSCIGVFNPEGSEANFKKMVELQAQSKKDYVEILNKLISKVTDEEAAMSIKAKKEAPETLHDIRSNILRDVFYSSKANSSQNAELEEYVHETVSF